MYRALLLAALGAAGAWLSPGVASAATLTPAGTVFGGPVALAAGPGGRALVLWSPKEGIGLVERDVTGRWSPGRTFATPEVFGQFAAWGPDGSAAVLAYDQSGGDLRKLVVFRRAAGAASFEAPTTIIEASMSFPVGFAANARGDMAVLVQRDQTSVVLLTAVRGGPFGPPQEVAPTTQGASLAVGHGGRVVHAYYDHERKGVYVRMGAAGSPLGAPQLVTKRASVSDIAAAVDDAGNATIAFALDDQHDRYRRSALVAARARPNGRFEAPVVVGRGGPREMGAGFASVTAAAAGTTTALAWDPNESADPHDDGRLGVSIARGAGRFERAQAPSAPALGRYGMHGGARNPVLAVDPAGDVLLAYSYGNAVHATQRTAGSTRFSIPRVLSTLGKGAVPSFALQGTRPAAALLSDRRPLVVHSDLRGALVATTRLDGPRPDLTWPRARVGLPPGAAGELRASNAVAVTVRCSELCVVQGRATLRTGAGRTIVYEGAGRILRPGIALTKRFAFDPAKRAGRARDGGQVRVTILVENASGASSTAVKRIDLGARRYRGRGQPIPQRNDRGGGRWGNAHTPPPRRPLLAALRLQACDGHPLQAPWQPPLPRRRSPSCPGPARSSRG